MTLQQLESRLSSVRVKLCRVLRKGEIKTLFVE